jgi:hypothetical protein
VEDVELAPLSRTKKKRKALHKGVFQRIQQPQRPSRVRACCLFTLCGVVCCYLQVAVNFLAIYHFGNDSHSSSPFSSWPWLFSRRKSDTTHGMLTNAQLLDMLSSLSQRAERLLQAQEPYRHPTEQVWKNMPYQNDGSFVAFTIRDARRTLPTQIPHGFQVFDFVNVHNPRTYYSILKDRDDDDDDDDSVNDENGSVEDEIDPLRFPAPLFLDGFPVPYPYNVSTLGNATADCQEYCLACYRTSLMQVMRYLLEGPHFQNATHFFYMESDHTLCTTLNEIRSIAYEYKRYLIAAGTGTSGWIMSRRFLQDFYEFYREDHEDDESLLQFNLTREDRFKPDVMAAMMLKTKGIPWSVTRRYLTSHTVLSSTAMGVADMSLTELFEIEKPDEDGNTTNSTVVANTTTTTAAAIATTSLNVTKVTTATAGKTREVRKKNEVEMLPPLVPKKHLPRCLEPHRGIVKSNDEGEDSGQNADLDLSRLVLFDYERCPDAMVFPCDDVDLKALVRDKNRLRGA